MLFAAERRVPITVCENFPFDNLFLTPYLVIDALWSYCCAVGDGPHTSSLILADHRNPEYGVLRFAIPLVCVEDTYMETQLQE